MIGNAVMSCLVKRDTTRVQALDLQISAAEIVRRRMQGNGPPGRARPLGLLLHLNNQSGFDGDGCIRWRCIIYTQVEFGKCQFRPNVQVYLASFLLPLAGAASGYCVQSGVLF